jgi:hypothetical protein
VIPCHDRAYDNIRNVQNDEAEISLNDLCCELGALTLRNQSVVSGCQRQFRTSLFRSDHEAHALITRRNVNLVQVPNPFSSLKVSDIMVVQQGSLVSTRCVGESLHLTATSQTMETAILHESNRGIDLLTPWTF